MDAKPAPIPTIAVAEYSLDLGIPILKFLTQLRLAATEEEALQIIRQSQFFINDTCINMQHINPHETILHTKDVAGAIIQLGEKKVKIIVWVDGD